tara:strand:- start:5658 stop:6173 length:516 start_codon:yes stop_codon:yes gene_type:complete
MKQKSNFKSICNLTEKVLNIPKGQLKNKSRKRPLQIGRQVAAMIGRNEEGIHQRIIGDILNRDRSLIYYYEHKHEDNYKYFLLYRDAYNKVYKAYKDIEGTKEFFIKGSHIKSYLLKNGIKEAPDGKEDVLLNIKSRDAKTVIKTTYLDFSNQLKIIKLALKNYHYSIDIV